MTLLMLNVVMLSVTFYAECSCAECLGAREKKQGNEIKSEKEMKGFERKVFEAKDKKVSCINQNVLCWRYNCRHNDK